MIYKSSQGDISLENLTRLYAAVLIEAGGEVAEMSLEWIESYADKVKILEYILVFDYTPPGSEERVKKSLSFATKEDLLNEIHSVTKFIESFQS